MSQNATQLVASPSSGKEQIGASIFEVFDLGKRQKKTVNSRKELALAHMGLTQKRLEEATKEWEKEINRLEEENLKIKEADSKPVSKGFWGFIAVVAVVLVVAVVAPVLLPALALAVGAALLIAEVTQNVQGKTMFFREDFWVDLEEGMEKLDEELFQKILINSNRKHSDVQKLQSKTQQHVQLELTPLESKKQAAVHLIQGALSAIRDMAESASRR